VGTSGTFFWSISLERLLSHWEIRVYAVLNGLTEFLLLGDCGCLCDLHRKSLSGQRCQMATDVQDFPSMNMRNVHELFISALYDSTLKTLKGLELQLNSISMAGVYNYCLFRDQMGLFQSDLLFTVNSHSANSPRVKKIVLSSTVILGSRTHCIHDHILPSHALGVVKLLTTVLRTPSP
jgi:hypothetical protein